LRFTWTLIVVSYTRANNHETSDHNFLVFSKVFKGTFFPQGTSMVYRKVLDPSASFDVLCCALEEFDGKKNELCLVKESVGEGMIVFKA
jgi:hypothetical protein